MPSYTNYRWEPSNKRKGVRYYYKRDVVWPVMPWRSEEPQVICTVQYAENPNDKNWGKWYLSFGAQSPGLNRLRLLELPPLFSSKDDAMAWAVAMIRLEGDI